MNFSNLTVRAKLTAAFGVLALMVLVVSGLSLKAIGDANDGFVRYVNGIAARADMAGQIQNAVDTRAIAARNLVLVSKPADLEVEKAVVLKAHADVQARIAKLEDMFAATSDKTEKAGALIAKIGKIEQSYGPVALAIVDLALKGKKDEAIVKMNDECRPLLAQLKANIEEYATFTDSRAQVLVVQAGEHVALQREILIGACLLTFLSATLAGIFITRSLTRALGAEPAVLGFAAQSIAAGDLSPLTGAAQAREGSVFASLALMQQSLAKIVGQVRGASDSIATGSAQIATGNADLSQRTEEQASSLQQTAATMDQLGVTVKHNADNAGQANQLARSASAIAVKGGDVVSQVVLTMKGINDSSRRIADIIGVIDGIAFQTNILALNAAVEAARAGEQGRGFAVVATEVRSLAQRSAEAAKEIKGLISASVERVEQGTTLVDQAGATMSEIVGSIQRVSDIVAEISAASGEQSAGVGQVGEAVSQMDRATQQNAALVEESAAAAESLRHQAEQLVSAVSVFNLGDRSLGGAPLSATRASVAHHTAPKAAKVTPAAVKKSSAATAQVVKAPVPKATPKSTPQVPQPVAAMGVSEDWESF
jgi:methyl-accepting chemotaxis protein